MIGYEASQKECGYKERFIIVSSVFSLLSFLLFFSMGDGWRPVPRAAYPLENIIKQMKAQINSEP